MTTIANETGSRTVVINEQDGRVWANLYVNTRNGWQNGDITMTRWEGKTIKGATTWAKKVLSR